MFYKEIWEQAEQQKVSGGTNFENLSMNEPP